MHLHHTTPPTRPFPQPLHTYTASNTPIPYPVKPPSFLHLLLPHILPPLLALYPNSPPKTQIALHLYSLVSQYGDRRGLQKSEKDLLWYDVLCCIEADSNAGRSSNNVNPQNEFWPIWNAFNGKGDIIYRNQLFMDWAREYMDRIQSHSSARTSANSSPNTSARGQKELPTLVKSRVSSSRDDQTTFIVRKGIEDREIRLAPSSLKNDKSIEAQKPQRGKIISSFGNDRILVKDDMNQRWQQHSTYSSKYFEDKHSFDKLYYQKSTFKEEFPDSTNSHTTNAINSAPKIGFPLDYAKRISERVSQKYKEQHINRAMEELYSDDFENAQRKEQSKDNLKVRRNINISSISIDEGDQKIQNVSSYISQNHSASELKLQGHSKINSVVAIVSESQLSKHRATSQHSIDRETYVPSPDSASFVKLLTHTQSPSMRGSTDMVSQQSNDDSPLDSLLSSPEKSSILESYLKASGDDILETASSFIDKFYDDIVSPSSKSLFSRRNSNASLLSSRSRKSYADFSYKKESDGARTESTKEVSPLNSSLPSIEAKVNDFQEKSDDSTNCDSVVSAVLSPMLDSAIHTESPMFFESNQLNQAMSNKQPMQEELHKLTDKRTISKDNYDNLLHEYWTNYKSIMKTAKWKAEVIDLIAETRAEYELEKRELGI